MLRKLILFNMVLLFLLPLCAHGQEKRSYIALKPGIYFFNGDLHDDHPMGFYGEILYGYHLYPDVALEGAIGYFHDGASKDKDVRGVPLTFSIKGILPVDDFELLAGAGAGVYFTKFRGEIGGVAVEDDDIVPGAHLLIGVNYEVTSGIFIGIEGKFIIIDNAKYDGKKIDLNGAAATGILGIRF